MPAHEQPAGSHAGRRLPRQRKPPEPRTRQPTSREPGPAGGARVKSKTDQAIEAAIAAVVAKAPPLSARTRARLADLFSVAAARRGLARRGRHADA